jgi:hypothetical protein
MGKIVISYSADHYNPDDNFRIVAGSGRIARLLHDSVKESFPRDDVFYCDYKDISKFRQFSNVDLLIGISENFNHISKILNPDRNILWAVNMPWTYRRNIVKKAIDSHFDLRKLSGQDGLRANSFELKRVDQVVTLGNHSNFRAYANLIGNPSRVFPVSCNFYQGKSRIQKSGGVILVYCGEISFRKGIDIIDQLMPHVSRLNARLRIVGKSQNAFVNSMLCAIKVKYANNFEHIEDWIEFQSVRWDQLISDVSFAIFPSREEGLASVLAELISEGIPTIYSKESGLDWISNCLQPETSSIESWEDTISAFFAFNEIQLSQFVEAQQNLLKLIGCEGVQINKLLKRVAKGGFWPEYHWKHELNRMTEPDSYVLGQSVSNFDFKGLTIRSKLPIENDYLELDLIALVDKYQNEKSFLVEIGNKEFQVSRDDYDSRVSRSDPIIEVISGSLSITSTSVFSKKMVSSLLPWVFHRRLNRVYLSLLKLFQCLRSSVFRM